MITVTGCTEFATAAAPDVVLVGQPARLDDQGVDGSGSASSDRPVTLDRPSRRDPRAGSRRRGQTMWLAMGPTSSKGQDAPPVAETMIFSARARRVGPAAGRRQRFVACEAGTSGRLSFGLLGGVGPREQRQADVTSLFLVVVDGGAVEDPSAVVALVDVRAGGSAVRTADRAYALWLVCDSALHDRGHLLSRREP